MRYLDGFLSKGLKSLEEMKKLKQLDGTLPGLKAR